MGPGGGAASRNPPGPGHGVLDWASPVGLWRRIGVGHSGSYEPNPTTLAVIANSRGRCCFSIAPFRPVLRVSVAPFPCWPSDSAPRTLHVGHPRDPNQSITRNYLCAVFLSAAS